jgi:hypothetical protein
MSNNQASLPVNVVYIMGAGRSGSTLLNRILDDHPHIVGVGELVHFADPFMNKTLCSCGVKIPECPFWSEVQRGWYEQTGANNLNTYHRLQCHFEQYTNPYHKQSRVDRLKRHIAGLPRLLRERHKPSADFLRYTEQTQALFEQIRGTSGGEVIVDASKSPLRAFALSMMPGIDLYVIHLVRDGRSVVSSTKKYRPNHEAGLGWDVRPIPVWVSALSWVRGNMLSSWLRRQIAQERTLFCRYEDLVQNPKETLSDIIAEKLLAAHPIPTSHILAGNVMRMSNITGLKHTAEWKKSLSPNELRTFNILAGWLNHQYGNQ